SPNITPLSLHDALPISSALLLVGCRSKSSDNAAQKTTTITVGASSTPHAKILEHVKPELKKEGVDLKVKVFDDYVMPNKALASKELDANYFQHKPFLNNWNKKNDGSLVDAGGVHLEPIGVYSKKYKNLKDLPQNSTVLVSSNVADYGRVLQMFK